MFVFGIQLICYVWLPIPWFSFFFSWLKCKFQWRCSFIVKSMYLTCVVRGIYWPLILKFRCFFLFLLDLGLNCKFRFDLFVFKDILFNLTHVVRSFKSWLMHLLIFFKELFISIKLVSSGKWCTLLNLMASFRSLKYNDHSLLHVVFYQLDRF